MMTTLALITGKALIYQLMYLLGILLCCGLLWALFRWIAGKLGGPPMAVTAIDILFAIIVVVVVVLFILSML